MVLQRYLSLKDSPDDTAYGLVQNQEGYLLIGIGPGFDPDGNNRPGWAWGSALALDNRPATDVSLDTLAEFHGMGTGRCLIRFDKWHDDDAVKRLIRILAN